MNKYEEAINYLTPIANSASDKMNYGKMLNLAIEALEKQVAKLCKEETVNHGIDISGEYDIRYNLLCPCCGAVVGDSECNELNGEFCSNCGQKLEWIGENDDE